MHKGAHYKEELPIPNMNSAEAEKSGSDILNNQMSC